MPKVNDSRCDAAARRRVARRRALFLSAAALVGLNSQFAAADWTGAVSTDWNDPNNWTGGVFPGGNAVVTTSSPNIATLTASSSFTPVDIIVGNGAGTNGRIDHISGNLSTGAGNWGIIGTNQSNGIYNLADTTTTGGSFTGYGQGTGSLNISGELEMAWNNGGNATVNVNTTGSLTVGGLIRVNDSNGNQTATLNIDSGNVSTNGEMWMGAWGTGTGTTNISGGTLSTGSWFVVGRSNHDGGQGILNQTGGTINAANAGGNTTIGSFGGSQGVMNLSGGFFNANNNSSIFVGEGGTGTLNVSGTSTVTITNATTGLEIGVNGAAVGTVNLNGGTIITPTVTRGSGSATFNFNGGLLQAGGSGTLMSTLTRANVRDGGAKIDTNGFSPTVSQALLHSNIGGDAATDGGLTKSGSGELTLSGANAYTGPTNVNSGSLAFSSAQSNIGTLTVANSAGLRGKLASASANLVNTSGNVTLGTNTITFDFNSLTPTATTSFVSLGGGTLTTGAAGSLSVTLQNTGGLTTGTYRLIDYPVATTIGGGGISAFPSGSFVLGARGVGQIQNDAINTAVVLAVTNDALVWSGAINSSWKTATTGDNTGAGNWALSTGHTATNFWVNDAVQFKDTYNAGAGNQSPATGVVAVDGGADVSPSKVTFNNSALNYVLNGPNGITGTGSLTKSGLGSVSINMANSYSGGTILNAGTLNINDPAALGTGQITIAGGTIDAPVTGIFFTNNNVQSWTGDFTFAGTNNLDMGTGAVSLDGAGATQSVTLGSGYLAVGKVFDSGAHNLSITGAGTLALTSQYAGAQHGSLVNGVVNVGTGATLQINRSQAGTGDNFDGDSNVGGLTGNGTITNGANQERWLFNNNATDLTFGGTLTDGGLGHLGFVENGATAAKQTLSGTSTMNGTLIVRNGTLEITGSMSTNGGECWVSDQNNAHGTLSVPTGGSLTVNNWFAVGRGGNDGKVNVSGGTINVTNNNFTIASFGGNIGQVTVTAGSINSTQASAASGKVFVGEGGTGTLNVGGSGPITSGAYANSGSVIASSTSAADAVSVAKNGGSTGTLNLGDGVAKGGLIQALQINGGAGTATVNFNGGTLQANAANPTFYVASATTTTNVRNLGLTVDSNGFDIGINSVLAHSAVGGDNAVDGGLTKKGTGTLTIGANNTYTGATAVNGGTVAFNVSQTNLAGGITVASGATGGIVAAGDTSGLINPQPALVTGAGDPSGYVPGDKYVITSNVTVAAGGKFDVNDGILVINSGTFSAVNAAVHAGRIFSSTAQYDASTLLGLTGLGMGDNFDLSYAGIGANNQLTITGSLIPAASDFGQQFIFKYTYIGDANLDGKVTTSDYDFVFGNLGSTTNGVTGNPVIWGDGDFNGNGVVDTTDLDNLFANLGFGTTGNVQPPLLPGTSVPEPSSVALLLLGLAGSAAVIRRKK